MERLTAKRARQEELIAKLNTSKRYGALGEKTEEIQVENNSEEESESENDDTISKSQTKRSSRKGTRHNQRTKRASPPS